MEQEKIEEIIKILKDELQCKAIVLFGSYARKTQRLDSDIDIAIKSKRKISKKEIFEMTEKLEKITKKDVDLIDLDSIQDGFRYEILMNGEILYCENSFEFDLYKIDMFREYLELNESRKCIIERIKKGGTIYGE